MNIQEQLRRILKAAPYLPYKAFTGTVMLLAIPFVIFKAVEGWNYKWTEGTAHPVEYVDVQERIVDKSANYFYKIIYSYKVNDKNYQIPKEMGSSTQAQAASALKDAKANPVALAVWYSGTNPGIATLRQEETYWQVYLLLLGVLN